MNESTQPVGDEKSGGVDRCYALVLPNGEEVETDDGTPHFTTMKDALAAVVLALKDGMDPLPAVHLLDAATQAFADGLHCRSCVIGGKA